jgi:tellurite resistance-related uncharacterized protein
MKKNMLFATYRKLPIWAKVAIPAAVVILFLSLLKTIKLVIMVGFVAVLIIGVLSGVAYLKREN